MEPALEEPPAAEQDSVTHGKSFVGARAKTMLESCALQPPLICNKKSLLSVVMKNRRRNTPVDTYFFRQININTYIAIYTYLPVAQVTNSSSKNSPRGVVAKLLLSSVKSGRGAEAGCPDRPRSAGLRQAVA